MSDEPDPATLAKAKFRFDFECIPCRFLFFMLDPINCAPECPQCGGPTQLLHVGAADHSQKTST